MSTMRPYLFVLPFLLPMMACGDDGGSAADVDAPVPVDGASVDSPPSIDADVTPDAPIAASITISGTARSVSGLGQTQAVEGATIAAYASSDDATSLATATTDAQGNFSLTVDTSSGPLVGYLKATATNYVDSYVYPAGPLAADTTDVPVILVTPATYDAIFTFTQVSREQGTGVIGLAVLDTTQAPVAGAAATSDPAATYKYNSAQGFPSSSATTTAADGAAYVLNAPVGTISVGATKQGATFASHDVKVWADALTTTPVLQQ